MIKLRIPLLLVVSWILTGTAFGEKPNILFIFADDMCHDAIAAHGHPEVKTPNLDRLARRGTTFSNAYNMGAWTGAVCVSSRTMLNTGMSVWRAHEADAKGIMQRGESWSQLMKSAGYDTYMSGKWHVRMKTKTIFDHVVHERPGMPNQTPAGYNRPLEGEPDKWSPYDKSFKGFWKGGKHWSEVLADDGTEFLKQAAASDNPFFMYLAFNAPHDPRQSPKKFVDMYPEKKIRIPDNYLTRYPYMQEMALESLGKKGKSVTLLRDEHLAPMPRTEYSIRVNRQEYFAIITHMDEQIGRLLDALEATGKMDSTYIFFTADHGLACGQHGLMGKQNMYEHSMRPPLMVAGPNVPEGETRDQAVYLQDIMASSLELAEVKKPSFVEFNSLMPIVKDGELASNYPEVYGCYLKDSQRMIRYGDWKLIVYPKAHAFRLFNLETDPSEMNDLAGHADQSERIRDLFQRLMALQEKMDDPMDMGEFFPALAKQLAAATVN